MDVSPSPTAGRQKLRFSNSPEYPIAMPNVAYRDHLRAYSIAERWYNAAGVTNLSDKRAKTKIGDLFEYLDGTRRARNAEQARLAEQQLEDQTNETAMMVTAQTVHGLSVPIKEVYTEIEVSDTIQLNMRQWRAYSSLDHETPALPSPPLKNVSSGFFKNATSSYVPNTTTPMTFSTATVASAPQTTTSLEYRVVERRLSNKTWSKTLFTTDELKKAQQYEAAAEFKREIKPVAYHMKEDVEAKSLMYGFIAQELDDVYPNLVYLTEDGFGRSYVGRGLLVVVLVIREDAGNSGFVGAVSYCPYKSRISRDDVGVIWNDLDWFQRNSRIV